MDDLRVAVRGEWQGVLRPRRTHDVPALLEVLQRTHDEQGYPVRREAVSKWWLASDEELGGWIATDADRVVGHVALHPASGAGLPLWQRATGREPEALAVVSRLFTDGTVRGAGAALLSLAVDQAGAAGREAVLQVDPESDARAFYARRGWREVGVARQQWGHRTVDAVVMVLGVPAA